MKKGIYLYLHVGVQPRGDRCLQTYYEPSSNNHLVFINNSSHYY